MTFEGFSSTGVLLLLLMLSAFDFLRAALLSDTFLNKHMELLGAYYDIEP